MSITYDSSILKSKLKKLNCKTLRRFLRSLVSLPNVSRIRKDDLVLAILRELKKPKKWKYISSKLDESCERITQKQKNSVVGSGWFLSKPTIEDTIICRLYSRTNTLERVSNKMYSERKCKNGERRPEWGKTSNSDCPRGYAILNQGGCCININEHIAIWNTEKMKKACVDCDNLSQQDKEYWTGMMNRGVDNTKTLGDTKFTNQTDASLTLGYVAEFQKSLILKLGSQFDSILADTDDGDDYCSMTSEEIDDSFSQHRPSTAESAYSYVSKVSKVANVAKTGLYVAGTTLGLAYEGGKIIAWALLKLWAIIRTILGWSLTAVMNVTLGVINAGWKIGCKISTIGQKIAYFLVSDPKQARMFLTLAKSVKKGMCRYMGNYLKDSPLLAALEHRLVTDESNIKSIDTVKKESLKIADTIKNDTKNSTLFEYMVSNGIGIAGIVAQYWDGSIMREYYTKTYQASLEYYQDAFGFHPPTPPRNNRNISASVTENALLTSFGPTAKQLDDEMRSEIVKMVKDDPVSGIMANMWSMFNGVVGEINDAVGVAMDSGIHTNMMEKMVSSDGFKRIANKSGRVIFAGVGGMLSGIPVVGGAIAAVSEEVGGMVGDATVEVTKDTIKLVVYKADLLKSFQLLIEVLDLDACLKEMPQIKQNFPTLYSRLELANFATKIGRAHV